jgi:hypothetical protein
VSFEFFQNLLSGSISLNDGAAGHFKNNYTLLNLKYHKKDFGLDAAWTFSASGHGKSPCDGIGATVKAAATRAALHGNSDAAFQKAFDFWSFTFDTNDRFETNEPSPIETYFLPKERVEEEFKNNLESRWEKLSSNSE